MNVICNGDKFENVFSNLNKRKNISDFKQDAWEFFSFSVSRASFGVFIFIALSRDIHAFSDHNLKFVK